MRRFAFFAPLAAVLAIAAPATAEPVAVTVVPGQVVQAQSERAGPVVVSVALGPDLQDQVETLGQRDVTEQTDRLMQVVARTLSGRRALDGARIDLVLTDLKPNRPTFQQLVDRPGLDGIRSVSIGGATIEGQITTADGTVSPIRFDWYSNSIEDVYGFSTWQDADRAYRRLAVNLAAGRYVTR